MPGRTGGPVPSVLVEILRRLQAQGRAELFFELLNQRLLPSQPLPRRGCSAPEAEGELAYVLERPV
ncbi:MAG: hypothetical protein ABSG64_08410 [Solirubrobacteraceae bacterium]